MLTIAGYNAAIRPALASSVGPDVFDVAPGGANGSVETYAPDAINLEPAVAKALGSDWQSKLSPIGVSSLMVGNKLAAVQALRKAVESLHSDGEYRSVMNEIVRRNSSN